MNLSTVKEKLEAAGVAFDKGLTEREIQLVEQSFRFSFPPDLKALLMFALPCGKSWPNWRNLEDPQIEVMMSWPTEGICFDIENNGFWPETWGTKPESLDQAFEVANQKVSAAPKLIPIYGHRYLPDRPSIEGNPVFSVYQTDIICYGSNLWRYFQNEFQYPSEGKSLQLDEPLRRIEFWSDLVFD